MTLQVISRYLECLSRYVAVMRVSAVGNLETQSCELAISPVHRISKEAEELLL
jgi:hypothetical protein